jgi:mannose-6-phosphate isomerase class I
LALEIRRPGPTFRAWDNVRFPIREVDVEAAVAALNLERTAPEEFLIEPEPVAERRGVLRSVVSEAFHIEHLRPQDGVPVSVPAEPPHCLHAIRGGARIVHGGGRLIGDLQQGESAIVPIATGEYQVESQAPGTEIVKVSLPPHA